MIVKSKALLRSQAGVRLERIEEMAGRQRSTLYKLSTYRPAQPRVFANEGEANQAFAREVAASLEDPIVAAMIERGAI